MKLTFENETFDAILAEITVFMLSQGFSVDGVQVDFVEQDVTGNPVPEEQPVPETPDDLTSTDATQVSSEQITEPEEKPKRKTRKKKEEPEPAPVQSGEEAKQAAITKLMDAYNDGKATEVKTLLEKFGVKKFGEVDPDRGVELLEAAEELA